MINKDQDIKFKLRSFRRKYYLNLAFRGLLIFLCLTISIFLVINVLEYSFRFGTILRACLLFLFIFTAVFSLVRYVFLPLYKIINARHGMNDEEAAFKIGSAFPEIGDKLLNIIQLRKFTGGLAKASIAQKSERIQGYNFVEAIDVKENKTYLKYLIAPAAIFIMLLILAPSFITGSSSRIIRFNQEFIAPPPFIFTLKNEDLLAFKNEDYNISLQLTGRAIPEKVYIISNGRKIKMDRTGSGQYTYTFKKIQHDVDFKFEAAGFVSSAYQVEAVSRPNLQHFNVYLDYPKYLNKKNERLNNVGNLQIPEGTSIKWQLKTLAAENAVIAFQSTDEKIHLQASDDQVFEFQRSFQETQIYSIHLENQYSKNKEKILYKIDVVPDQYPKIDVNTFGDTTLYAFIALAGNISDDYGLTRLKLFYQTVEDGKESPYKGIDIPIDSKQNSQGYYYQWLIDSLGLKHGNKLKYFLKVWDNDGVNGRKSSKTGIYKFSIPSKKELKEGIDKASSETEKDINKTVEQAKELRESIEKAEKKFRGQQNLNWQDKNALKDIVEKRKALNEAIEELKKQSQNNELKRQRFSKNDTRIKEKVQQLQQLMDELLDEETKKLYEELQKLLEEKSKLDDIQDVLNKLNYKSNNLEKELERTLELFKRMKLDYKLHEATKMLKEQLEEQENLIEETKDKTTKNSELSQKQEELQEEFKELQEEINQLQELNQELKNPQALPDTKREEQIIEEEQQQSKESLERNNRTKSGKSQQKAREQMQKMTQQMMKMQSSMEMTMMMENLDDLRDIVHNLLKLSFDQEELMIEFSEVNQSDPRFVELAQHQLKLKDDAKIVEDSLLSLAGRVFQLASFVTREVGEMNAHMDKSMSAIKERKKPLAIAEQQFAMTSMNNLALLLDDALQQMQNALSEAMGKPGKGKGKNKPFSLGELQQQLNQKINNLKKSGKTGRALSEELARLAAEQARIRQALQEKQKEIGKGEHGKDPGAGIIEKMEDTEKDLVHKRITEETIERQKEILTRLLEAENAMRERELDEERKGETAKPYDKIIPKAFKEYFEMKKNEIELLKTVPPKLYPYYKEEVSEYFKRLGRESNKQAE